VIRLLRRLRAYVRILPRARPDAATTEAFRALARRPALLAATSGYELATLVSNRLDPRVKYLAVLETSQRIDCPFCLDIGSAVSGSLGIDEETLVELPRYPKSDRFSPLEKAALELAEDMTATPANVAPELRERLRAELTPGQLAELVSAIAWENYQARLNRALGVGAMAFAAGGFCLVLEQPAPRAGQLG
jgi:alkylhydroperoxidase family enzyme